MNKYIPEPLSSSASNRLPTSLSDLLLSLIRYRWLLLLLPIGIGAAALGWTYVMAPTFTARTTFLPPQPPGSAATAIASLGALASLAGTAAGIKNSGDQFVTLLQSDKVADRIIDEFKLMAVYKSQYRVDARATLAAKVHVDVGKKDGVISIEVDDSEPLRAADIANRHVHELRRLTSEFALTEAQQRRVFFESELRKTQDRLTQSQRALQSSGFNAGALNVEPKAAGETYARLRAEVTAAEMQLQLLSLGLADTTPEVLQQSSMVATLRRQLAAAERVTPSVNGPDYIGRYREFKYQETLFEIFSRQYEVARLDEAREGAMIQVIDVATAPERRSKPKRVNIAVVATLASFLALSFCLLVWQSWKRSDPAAAGQAALASGP